MRLIHEPVLVGKMLRPLAGPPMSLPLIVTPEAEADLADAKTWYERQREGLEERFVLCVEARSIESGESQRRPARFTPGVQRVVVRYLPYGVIFRIDEDHIAVMAVYHSKRNPRGWQDRT